MRKINSNKSVSENILTFEHYKNSIEIDIQKKSIDNRQKVEEKIHVCKFLMLLNNDYNRVYCFEEPDFIVSDATQEIGLEVRRIVDSISKNREGFL